MRRLCFVALLILFSIKLLVTECCAQATQAASSDVRESVPAWEQKLQQQFKSTLYGSMQNEETGCISCHSSDGTSPLVLSGNLRDDFRLLLDNRYFDATGPDTLLGRVTSTNPQRRMPKDAEPWSKAQIKQLRGLVLSVEETEQETGVRSDEQFPRTLLSPYHGQPAAADDNQFISYRQLVGKTKVIFDDDWVRGDRDLFAENVAMFGGADFKASFNESTEPDANYLTGLEMLARDVSSRAYLRRSGPFASWQEPASDPRKLKTVDDAHRQAISRLFQRILYRDPSEVELGQSLNLLRGVRELEGEISQQDSRLVFELTAAEPESGQRAARTIDIPVSGDRLDVRQLIVDQRDRAGKASEDTEPAVDPSVNKSIAKIMSAASKISSNKQLQQTVLGTSVHLSPGEPNQRVVICNNHTYRNVSFAGVMIGNSNGEVVSTIKADSPIVQVDGAWELDRDGGLISYEDGNRHKGLSSITVPLKVEDSGDFYIDILWRANSKNTPHALVQLFAKGAGNQLQSVDQPVIPEMGSTNFFYDCSNDTEPYFELDGVFQFDADSYVEISNAGTLQQVTAGAVEFLPVGSEGKAFEIDSQDAGGRKDWSQFDEGRFKAYNVKGKKLHDNNKNKGKLFLKYRPSSKPADAKKPGWQEAEYYRVRIYYPGKSEQETRVPVTVVAKRSSPIVQVSYPVLAKADAVLRMNASASYTVQASKLEFAWKQVSGPTVELSDANSAIVEFKVPRLNSRQFAWSALCGALIRHPDFLFTRPPSLATANEVNKQKLKLLKLALDLVGRPPTQEEIGSLASGTPYADFVDRYLESDEFRDFYFHRIRLYLESQGTTVQDEPARLWCYIAFNDRSFKELLTADYTVNKDFEREKRPPYHGKTGVLTTEGFIQGKPGLPHYNYSAQVSMLFLGYVYEVPPEIVEQREGVTALGTTDPNSNCYSCHKILTPLAFQRLNWTDEGKFRTKDEDGLEIDASDRGAVDEYPFRGTGLEAFATQASEKERFIRTIINTHVNFYFGRPLRHREDERVLYKRLWDNVHDHGFKIRELIRSIVTSDEYLGVSDKSDAIAVSKN